MDFRFLSPLLKPKKAMDSLLESMTTDDYDSLGAHRRGESTPESKGTEFDGTLNGQGFAPSGIVIPSKDFAPPPDKEAHEFGEVTLEPVEEEFKEHEFFKEAPEFEMSSSGVRRLGGTMSPNHSLEWQQIQDTVIAHGYNWLGRSTDGTEMWGKKKQQLVYDPATRAWFHRAEGNVDLEGAVEELEAKITAYDADQRAVTAAKKPVFDLDVFDGNWGGWILRNGDQYAIDEEEAEQEDKSGHDLAALRLKLGDSQNALQKGAIRVDLSNGLGTLFEFSQLDERTKDLLKDNVFEASKNAPIEFELWKPRHIHKKFQNAGEALEFIERPSAAWAVASEDSFLKSCVACIEHDKSAAPQTAEDIRPPAGEPYCAGCGRAKKDCACEGCNCPENSNRKSAGRVLYHVTRTEKVQALREDGITPLNPSNYTQGEGGERYGKGEIFAFENLNDAVRWAAKMDWDFHKQMGTGKISIVMFAPAKGQRWERDTNDPISQAGAKGKWLKLWGSVKPEQIQRSMPVTHETVKSVVQGKDIEFEKEAGLVSYGMNQPLGGTANPAGGTDDPAEDEELNAEMDMTASEDEDDFDYEAEDARLAAEMDGQDRASEVRAVKIALALDSAPIAAARSKIASMDDAGWWSKSARPTPQKVELLQKQFKLTPEQIELCIAADPSPNQTDFVAWLAKFLSVHRGRGSYNPRPSWSRLRQQPKVEGATASMKSKLLKRKSAGQAYEAKAYIEWGGMYDSRRLELDEYKGVYEWTDFGASDALDLGRQIGECQSLDEAKSRLEQVVFSIGEPATYIAWGDGTSTKKADYLKPGEKKFLRDTGVNEDIKPDFSRGNYMPARQQTDKEFMQSMGIQSRLLKRQGSSLLKRKRALVDMHDTPTMLPPRDDIKRHLDEQEQLALTDDVREGISPDTLKPRIKQIDPRINPDGIVASKVADYGDEEFGQEQQDEYFLEQVADAKNEAKRRFMEEDYLQQEADERVPPVSMEQLWEEMGDEYTAEFYGYPHKRVQDFTDRPIEGWEGRRVSSRHCPMCKSANVKHVDDDAKGYNSGIVLAECQDCRGYYSLLSH